MKGKRGRGGRERSKGERGNGGGGGEERGGGCVMALGGWIYTYILRIGYGTIKTVP